MKSYTDIEQSKKLAEILPVESADMFWMHVEEKSPKIDFWKVETIQRNFKPYSMDIPAWSLAALLGVLPKEIEIDGQHYAPCLFPVKSKWLLKLWYNSNYTITSPISIFSDNPVDACYEMILKLKENNLL